MQNLSANDTVNACIIDFAKEPMDVYRTISHSIQKNCLVTLSLIKGVKQETKKLSTLKLNIDDISGSIKNIPPLDTLQELLKEATEVTSTLSIY